MQKARHPYSDIAWRPLYQWRRDAIPRAWRDWLGHSGSLTRRLMTACGGELEVRVLRQTMALPRRDEARALGLPSRRFALIREVVLLGAGEPWVFARSVLPTTTLTGRLRRLRHLDERPLGELLFRDPGMSRDEIQVARVPGELLPATLAARDAALWGRRSVFRLDRKPLLVSEIFLPGFNPKVAPVAEGLA